MKDWRDEEEDDIDEPIKGLIWGTIIMACLCVAGWFIWNVVHMIVVAHALHLIK